MSVPQLREVLPALELIDEQGKVSQLWAMQPRRNLLLVFLCGGTSRALAWLSILASRQDALQDEEIRVIPVLHGTFSQARALRKEFAIPFEFLSDPDGAAHRRFGALSDTGPSGPAVYLCDRYGEIYAAFRTLDGDGMPAIDEVLASFRHINTKCDE